ncbi:hypothetical protein EG68_01565 [Paragonimus skrjabini miyazakii]|uniref:Potassium channel domain-containing protein n=1 Tax=Paragonimus skrjabini miyazakii TaxID=59628 RepID=A0A8S9Z1D5_9TREM|nr:hypothetical protein EG68_01565 [Paragonimus skrjabini miyazakii]
MKEDNCATKFVVNRPPTSSLPRFQRAKSSFSPSNSESVTERSDQLQQNSCGVPKDCNLSTKVKQTENNEEIRIVISKKFTVQPKDLSPNPHLVPKKSAHSTCGCCINCRSSNPNGGTPQSLSTSLNNGNEQAIEYRNIALGITNRKDQTKCQKLLGYFKRLISFLFSHIGLCLLVAGYCAGGAFLFRGIERDHQRQMVNKHLKELLADHRLMQNVFFNLQKTLIANCSSFALEWLQVQQNDRMNSFELIRTVPMESLEDKTSPAEELGLNFSTPLELENITNRLHEMLDELISEYVAKLVTHTEDLIHSAFRAYGAGWKPGVDHGFLPSLCTNCSFITSTSSSDKFNRCNCPEKTNCPINCFYEDLQTNPSYQAIDIYGEDDMWTLTGSLLYALTVITTIGYGHIVPRTDLGRAVTLIYALFGIPLVLLCLANMGGFLASCVRFLYFNTCLRLSQGKRQHKSVENTSGQTAASDHFHPNEKKPHNSKKGKRKNHQTNADSTKPSISSKPDDMDSKIPRQHTPEGDEESSIIGVLDMRYQRHSRSSLVFDMTAQQILHTIATSQSIISKKTNQRCSPGEINVPSWLSLLLLIVYVTIGSIIFANWEGWTTLQSAYFIFITLSTIGFGDFVPGIQNDQWYADSRKPVFCCFYLLFGLSIIAMCFSLMQEEVRMRFRRFAKKVGLVDE